MALWTAKQIWAGLPRERREAAALALWEDDHLTRVARLTALAPWLNARGMRLAFLEQLPRTRRAHLMADGGMPEETATQALMSYHLARQRPMLARFLDELGIPNDNGLIKEGDQPDPPAQDALVAAVEKLRTEFPAEDVELYLRTLTATAADTWANLAEMTGQPA